MVRDFVFTILCKRNRNDVFFNKRCVGGRRCPKCGNLALFHRHFTFYLEHSELSYITVMWKRYENVTIGASYSSTTTSKMIYLLEDKIPIPYFIEKLP